MLDDIILEGTPSSNCYFRLSIHFIEDPPAKPPEIKFFT
jgi:ubiquitin-protein ligase